MERCFNNDWRHSKIEKLISHYPQEDLREFKDLLRAKYKDLKECYKHYASFQPAGGEIWSLSQNVFTDFLLKSNLVDNTLMTL